MSGRLTLGAGRATKYGNIKVSRGNEHFDSKREAARFDALRLLEHAGRIRNLRRQVKYRCEVNGILICTYKADFVYDEMGTAGAWTEVVEDSKGYANDRWPMKKKLMFACHAVKIRET